VAVVDPDVGSWRSAIVVATEHFLFVGPDNGLLSLAARDDGIRRVIEVRDPHERWTKSQSFDGLTLFTPVAAFLATGGSLDEVGGEADDLVNLPDPQPTRVGLAVVGQILLVDRFGNCITNIHKNQMGSRVIERVVIQPGLEARVCNHYAELAGSGVPGALWNSDGHLELALFGQSMAARHGLQPGQVIRLFFKGQG
jgi:S-adenosylmethionine hydrolase